MVDFNKQMIQQLILEYEKLGITITEKDIATVMFINVLGNLKGFYLVGDDAMDHVQLVFNANTCEYYFMRYKHIK